MPVEDVLNEPIFFNRQVTVLASLMLDGVAHLCSIHERSLAALLLDLVALKLLGQKQGFITRLLVA